MNEYKKRTACAICGNKNLQKIINFGRVPLAGNFPKKEELESVKKYELSLLFCEQCFLVQTDSIIDSDYLFRDYRYMSSVGLTNHFNQVANYYKDRFNLNTENKILEIGSNDGVLLKPMQDLGLDILGFEPAINISKVAIDRGCKVIVDYFNKDNAEKYLKEKYDLIISNNCFAHIENIKSIVEGIKNCLHDSGTFVFEVHYLKKLIDELQYDFIYHEHLYYYSLSSLQNLFRQFDMSIVDYEEISIHSGSIRVFVKNGLVENQKVNEHIKYEKELGLTSIEYFKSFQSKVIDHINGIKLFVKKLKDKNTKIAGYGASGRGNMLINVTGITSEEIDFIIDESPERYDRFIAGTNIPIYKLEVLDEHKPDYLILFAWNYAELIKSKLKMYNFKYIIPFPQIYEDN